MLPFETAYASAKHQIYSHPNKVALLRSRINSMAEYIYSVYLSSPEKSFDQVIDSIFDDFETSAMVPFVNPLIHYTSIRYEACMYLLEHPQKIDEILETIKENNIECPKIDKNNITSIPVGFSGDFEESLLYFVLYEKADFDNFMAEFSPHEIEYIRKNITTLKKSLGSLPFQTRRFIEKSIPLVIGSYSQRLKQFMLQNQALYERDLKENLANSISSLTETLDKYGLFKDSCNLYNNQMTELGLPDLTISLTSTNANPGLNTLLSPNYLARLPLDQLLLLNHFYINRISKEFDKIKYGLFVIDDLNLYKTIIANRGKGIGYGIEESKLYDELVKMQILQIAANDYYSKIPKDLSSFVTSSGEFYSSEEKHSSIISTARKSWNKKYATTFYSNDDDEESKKYLSYDLSFYLRLHEPIYASYMYKDNSSTAIMAHLLHSSSFMNWGYIPEPNCKGQNTIQAGNKFILIGVDCEGLNRPIFTHEVSDKLREFFKTYAEKTLIPVYEGLEDFKASRRILENRPSTYAELDILKNNIVAPISNKHKKIIKILSKSNTPEVTDNYKFIQHINFLRTHTEFPKHLKTLIPNNTGELSLEKPERFVDLETGLYYQKISDRFERIDSLSNEMVCTTSKGVLNDDSERE